MYTAIKNYQIIIALLKKYHIKHLVLSAGTRNVPFVHSVEKDPFFTCYSVVDERSAAYFAMGIAQEINTPVLISCTSSTATTNYFPAITEAYHLKVPLIVLTSDRDQYLLDQMEDQMIRQAGMYGTMVKKSVNLPFVNNDNDFWYCERLVNEALLELEHRGNGPVHINVPTYGDINNFSISKLPDVKKIERISASDNEKLWLEKVTKIKEYKKILVICGQSGRFNKELTIFLELFSKKYNCLITKDHMSNLHNNNFFATTELTHSLRPGKFDKLLPDLIISFGGNFMSLFKPLFRENYKKIDHWLINENGDVIDTFKSLKCIFECNANYFFHFFANNAPKKLKNNLEFKNLWESKISKKDKAELPFSNISAIKEFTSKLPDNTLLHLSVLNSIRITNFFKIPPNTKVYANIGSHGIDGCMSTFLGQSVVSDRLSFLVIGDLSFFYDMNSIRIKHIKNNVRILLINNWGGAEFQKNHSHVIPSLDLHTSARHNITAKTWAEAVGFNYQSASALHEFSEELDYFIYPESNKPKLFEVFTEMETDAQVLNQYLSDEKTTVNTSKELIKSVLGDKGTKVLKNLIKQ